MARKKKIKRIHLDIRDNISPKTAIECVYKIINTKQKNFDTKLKTDDGIICIAKRFYLQIDSFKIEYWKGGEQ